MSRIPRNTNARCIACHDVDCALYKCDRCGEVNCALGIDWHKGQHPSDSRVHICTRCGISPQRVKGDI